MKEARFAGIARVLCVVMAATLIMAAASVSFAKSTSSSKSSSSSSSKSSTSSYKSSGSSSTSSSVSTKPSKPVVAKAKAKAKVKAKKKKKGGHSGGDDVFQVSYTNSGFAPSYLEIEEGELVIWTNNSGAKLKLTEGTHPSHADCAYCPQGKQKNSFVGVKSGAQYSFRFHNIGRAVLHDEAKPGRKMTIDIVPDDD